MAIIDYIAIILVVLLAVATTYVVYSAIELSNSLYELEEKIDTLESRSKKLKDFIDEYTD